MVRGNGCNDVLGTDIGGLEPYYYGNGLCNCFLETSEYIEKDIINNVININE